MAMFNGASNFIVNGGLFVANATNPSKVVLDRLVGEVAPNAILNAGGRADEVRCFPGTREEVIGKLEKFMDDDSPDRKRMMWLSGPAVAGKSAICQTVAERRSEQERHAANFFFFRGDVTRSHSRPLVATLVYQLRQLYPALDGPLTNCLEMNPLICSASVGAQFKQLITSPIQTIQQSTLIQQQIVIIIDGLDECTNDKRDQDQILVALHTLAHADHSPFLVLVSSRAEPQLVMSFNRLGASVESIFLNEDYRPEEDIHRFVIAKFAEIKKDHHLAQSLDEDWPTDADIDAIIDQSSNQFIYAATVMRFIQFSSENPALSLFTILETSGSEDHNPLSHLDAVYSHIFSKARNIQAVKIILFAKICARTHFSDMLRLVGYTAIQVESIFADLVAIIQVDADLDYFGPLTFYHASLEDYLLDKSRSTIYCVNDEEIIVKLLIMGLNNLENIDALSWVHTPTPGLFDCLLNASRKRLASPAITVLGLDDFISHIERLYWEHDRYQFKLLLQGWNRFLHVNKIDEHPRYKIRPQNPAASLYYKRYWTPVGKPGPTKSNKKAVSAEVEDLDAKNSKSKRNVKRVTFKEVDSEV